MSSFLRWDVYCTCATLAVWAEYQWQAEQETSRVVAMLCKIGFWAVLGGPLAPAIMLLWERDSLVLSRGSKSTKAKKTRDACRKVYAGVAEKWTLSAIRPPAQFGVHSACCRGRGKLKPCLARH